MSSKAQTVSVKKEVTAELMVDDFRVLHIQDIALPSTEFIPTHHVPQEKLSSAEADIVPQEPDSFDIDITADEEDDSSYADAPINKKRFMGDQADNGVEFNLSALNDTSPIQIPDLFDMDFSESDMNEEDTDSIDSAAPETNDGDNIPLTNPEENADAEHPLANLELLVNQRLQEFQAEVQWARERANQRAAGELVDETLALYPVVPFEDDPLAIHLCRLTLKFPQSTTHPHDQLKFIPGEWPVAADSAYYPLPRKAVPIPVSKRNLNPPNAMMVYASKVNVFDYNAGYSGKPALGRPSFCPTLGSCVGVVPTASGTDTNELIFFSWYHQQVWPRAIPESKSYLGRRMGVKGPRALNPHHIPCRAVPDRCKIVIGGTTRLKSVGAVDGVVWTDSNEIAAHGSDQSSSAILHRFLVDWNVLDVEARPMGSFRLPLASPITELEKSPISKQLLSGHEDGTVCIFDWEKLSSVPPQPTAAARSSTSRANASLQHTKPFYDASAGKDDSELQIDLADPRTYSTPAEINSSSNKMRVDARSTNFSASCFKPTRVKPANCRNTPAERWKFDHRVSSVRWSPGTAEIASVTLDNGHLYLLDMRTKGRIASSYQKSIIPANSHDHGEAHEIIVGDCRGVLSIHDLRRIGGARYTPYTFLDVSQGVIGDVRYHAELSTLAISGSPSLSFWNRGGRKGWSLVGSTYVDDSSLLPASHVTNVANAPGTSIFAATTSAGSLALYDV